MAGNRKGYAVRLSQSDLKGLSEIQKNKLKVINFSYNDTIDYGIPLFFKEYAF